LFVGWSRPHRIRSDAGACEVVSTTPLALLEPASPRPTNQEIKPINRSTNQINMNKSN
jgi:hypothetical protein